MTIKDLSKLIKICQRSGVNYVKMGNTELKFVDSVVEKKSKVFSKGPTDESKPIDNPMDTLLWSVPDMDPLKGKIG